MATCETHGHIWGVGDVCVFCKTQKPVETPSSNECAIGYAGSFDPNEDLMREQTKVSDAELAQRLNCLADVVEPEEEWELREAARRLSTDPAAPSSKTSVHTELIATSCGLFANSQNLSFWPTPATVKKWAELMQTAADEIDRLRGQLDAAEQHVKILQEQRAADEPPAVNEVQAAANRIANEIELHGEQDPFTADLRTLVAAVRASQPPTAVPRPLAYRLVDHWRRYGLTDTWLIDRLSGSQPPPREVQEQYDAHVRASETKFGCTNGNKCRWMSNTADMCANCQARHAGAPHETGASNGD